MRQPCHGPAPAESQCGLARRFQQLSPARFRRARTSVSLPLDASRAQTHLASGAMQIARPRSSLLLFLPSRFLLTLHFTWLNLSMELKLMCLSLIHPENAFP